MPILTDPNILQLIPLNDIEPSDKNVRLFIERESLEVLERRYREWRFDYNVILPDPPIVRYREGKPFELIAGHRRIQAAGNAGLINLWVRIVDVDDETAYRLIREANNYETLTTVEKAYSVAEMLRLGFTDEQVRESLGNIGISRYNRVGSLVHPDWFSDVPKRCDPSITVWNYAARLGPDHFRHCFDNWNSGLWDEDDCSREFRRFGRAKPPEPYQAGAILSVDETGKVLRFRGTLDLSQWDAETIKMEILFPFLESLFAAQDLALDRNSFGIKRNYRFSPLDESDEE
jgi:hypothetical protein